MDYTLGGILFMCIFLFPATTIGGFLVGLFVRDRSTVLVAVLCLVVANLMWLGAVGLSRWPQTFEGAVIFLAFWLVSFVVSFLLGGILRWIKNALLSEESRMLNH